ncbi:MAG: insulinase family protein [Chitinophagales bacterium]|nr:insulinase family protein [Chitinophagales bacterium]
MKPILEYPESNINIVKFTVILPGGRIAEIKKAQSFLTAKMIKKGSKNHTAFQIEEILDFNGATIEVESGYDEIHISLFCLKKQFLALIPLFHEVVFEAVFEPHEFSLLKNIRIEKLKQALSKNESVAERTLGVHLFGADHPYGYATSEQNYIDIQLEDIEYFYRKHYQKLKAKYMIVGDYDASFIDTITALFIPNNYQPNPGDDAQPFSLSPSAEKYHTVKLPNPYQSSIKIGWHTIAPAHPDSIDLSILNTIFGGYFGSRLMGNIREEKGYTYGIYSQIFNQKYGSYGYISTDTDKKHIDKVLKEIQHEIDQLKQVLIPIEELDLVKNYLKGDLLRDIDGSFKLAEAQYRIMKFGLSADYYTRFLERIDQITAEDLKAIANKYLNFGQCHVIVV